MSDSLLWTGVGVVAVIAALLWVFSKKTKTESTKTYPGTADEVLRQLEAEGTPQEKEEDRIYGIAFEIEDACYGLSDEEALAEATKRLRALSPEDRAKVVETIQKNPDDVRFVNVVEEAVGNLAKV